MSLLIFSHTDYSLLWPIIEESIEKCKIQNLNKIFCCNETKIIKPKGFEKYIEYDKNLCYAKRWTDNILPFVESEFILILHDVQVIINFNEKFITNIIEIMNKNNIDRCSLNVFNGIDLIEKNNETLCNLNSASGKTFTPYDVSPSIWKKNSFKTLFETFPEETYRTSELNDFLQTFCKDNFKCFGLQKNYKKIYYCLNRPHLDDFKILYITIKNEITFPLEVYMDAKDDFLYYSNKYNLLEKININNSYKCILDSFSPL